MLKRLTIAMSMLLVVVVCATVFVSVLNKTHKVEPVKAQSVVFTEENSSTETENEEESESLEEESSTDEKVAVETSTPVSDKYSSATAFKVKLLTRTFSKQNDRIKRFKTYFDKTYEADKVDVFLYDITHDGLADMLVVTPVYNDDGKKIIGSVIQLLTITDGTVVTELFRDYGGYSHEGGNFCCYVTEKEGKDCLLIAKDELWDGKGKLSFSIFYVLDDGRVINRASSQYASAEDEAYETEDAFNNYSSLLETEIFNAHTTIVDYRNPYAVTSKASDVFGKYIK